MVDQKPSLTGKRIIILFGSLELGGAERQGLLLAKHLKEKHHAHVEVFGFNSPGKSARICEKEGIPWRIVPHPFSGNRFQRWLRLFHFILVLRKRRPHILLPYTMVPNVCCGIAWRWTGAQLCIWNQRDEGLERMPYKLEQWALHHTPFFIANSQKGAEFLIEELKVKSELVRVIHNGVQLDVPRKSREEWRQQLGLGDAFTACMVSNLSPFKDWSTLFKAWRLVVQERRQIGEKPVLLLAGSYCNMYPLLYDLAVEQEIDNNVLFLGRIDDISGLLNAVDLAVFSSRSEGLPNGVLESMAAGLPVVGTDIPGIREVVGPAGLPFLAPDEDRKKFADLIIHFIANQALRKEIGKALRQRSQVEFGSDKMNARMVELISELVS